MHLRHFFGQTVNSTKIEFFRLSLQPLLYSRLERFIVRIADSTKVRFQIVEQKIVPGSQVRTVCRVVLLYEAAVANSLLCNHGLVDWSVVVQQPDSSRVANRPGMAGIVPELTHGVPCPGQAHFVPEM